jgi:hypothetical protein
MSLGDERQGLWPSTAGKLTKDRTLFRFGKRVESVCVKNATGAAVTVDVQVARDPVFYWPQSPSGGHGNRREIRQETYFYFTVPAGSTAFSPPFYARRGLKIKGVGSASVWAGAIVHGVVEGEIETKDIG